jgi:Xaa-Pro aminopeptidase
MYSIYKNRIKKVLAILKKDENPAAILISSAAPKTRSSDTDYPYMQDKNLFYLCGSNEPEMALLISPLFKTPILFVPPASKQKIIWEGPRYDLKTALKNSGAELIEYKNFQSEILQKLKSIDSLYYQNTENSLSFKIAKYLMDLAPHRRGKLPSKLKHADNIMGKLRLYKEPGEVKIIEKAAEITFNSWCLALPLLIKGSSENLLAATIEYAFRTQGADYAFQSIVASGKNASVLHYHKLQSKLSEKDLVLFDIGASLDGYSADISRTIPVSRIFSKWQRELYSIVLGAQKAAIKKIRHGVLIKAVHDAASLEIIKGLIRLKILKGNPKALLKKSAHHPYFPHGIGHSLGLDVHDIGNHRGNNEARLEKGMVFTVEPGIYLPKGARGIPACGIRIEDDVLVTAGGCKVLSSFIPKEIDDIEELLASF